MFSYDNILTATWLQPTCRNVHMCPKFLLLNSTNTWSARINLFYHLSSTSIRIKNPLTWKLLTHPKTYIGTIGMILAIGIGVYCFKRYLFRPATLRHWPYHPVSSWHAIVDDDVEGTTMYRGGSLVENPVKSSGNHAMCIEQEATKTEWSLATKTKIEGMW